MKIDTPVLKRLGPVPFWRGENRCLDALETMYRRAMAAADHALGGGTKSDGSAPAEQYGSRKPRRKA